MVWMLCHNTLMFICSKHIFYICDEMRAFLVSVINKVESEDKHVVTQAMKAFMNRCESGWGLVEGGWVDGAWCEDEWRSVWR